MRRLLAVLVGVASSVVASAALAVPPTAQENPGYQRRLQESRQPRLVRPVEVGPPRVVRPPKRRRRR